MFTYKQNKMQKLNIAYLEIKDDLLYSMDDDEFKEWLRCDDCTTEDYEALMEVLREKEMYDWQIDVYQYMREMENG